MRVTLFPLAPSMFAAPVFAFLCYPPACPVAGGILA